MDRIVKLIHEPGCVTNDVQRGTSVLALFRRAEQPFELLNRAKMISTSVEMNDRPMADASRAFCEYRMLLRISRVPPFEKSSLMIVWQISQRSKFTTMLSAKDDPCNARSYFS